LRREKVVKVRLSAAEHARLGQLAESWGIATRAGMLRALLRGAGAREETLIPGTGLEMALQELADLDASESAF
jgi:hypothetical protein